MGIEDHGEQRRVKVSCPQVSLGWNIRCIGLNGDHKERCPCPNAQTLYVLSYLEKEYLWMYLC